MSLNGGTLEQSKPLDLVVELCQELRDRQVRYCHWKSNEAIDRSATGDNDLDLLVGRSDADRFGETLQRLGFKEARPSAAREVPGLIDHYGLDHGSGRLVHLQAHYQLVLGDDMTKNFRLPVETSYLDASRTHGLFPLPPPDFELTLFVVRMVLKHASWDAQACTLGRLSSSEERELSYLFGRVAPQDRVAALVGNLPLLTRDLAEDCLEALQPGTSRRSRAAVARELETQLAAYSRRPRWVDTALRTGRRGARLASHVRGRKARKRLVAGGSLISVTGADAAATSRLADEMVHWLGQAFATRRFDAALAGADRSSSSSSVVAARRYAANGDIAICHLLDPRAPDVLLLLEPKPGAAPAAMSSGVLDGDRPAGEILAEARRLVWACL